jgi:hypothetical protein
MKAIKSCKFQLDQDATLGVQGVSKNPIVGLHFIINFHSKNNFFPICHIHMKSLVPKRYKRQIQNCLTTP